MAVTDEGTLQLLDLADLSQQGSAAGVCWPLDAAAKKLMLHPPDSLLAVLCSREVCALWSSGLKLQWRSDHCLRYSAQAPCHCKRPGQLLLVVSHAE